MSTHCCSKWLCSVAFVVTAVAYCPLVSQAGVISFNQSRGWNYAANGFVASPQSNGMAPAETAGAPGVNVANWNNIFTDYREDNSLDPAPPAGLDNNETNGPYGGNWTTTYGQPIDDSGVAQTGMSVTWYERGSLGGSGGGTDDVRMFSSDWDAWGRGTDEAGSPVNLGAGIDAKINISGIPYGQYDVYVYARPAAESFGTRGGTIIANGIEKGMSITNVPVGTYVEVPIDGAYAVDNGDDWDGTFIHFTGLSGDLELISDATTGGGQRLPISGFQIVSTGLPRIPGDFDADGDVDRTDVALFVAAYGNTSGGGFPSGDYDGDGKTGLSDLALTQLHFGESTEVLSPSAVPEPTALFIAAIGLLGLVSRSRRRKI